MKKRRQAKILEIINNLDVETQEDLQMLLRDGGFEVTQATISRDIRELKLTKVTVDGVHQKYTQLQEKETNLYSKYVSVLRDGFLWMEQAENILVIRTLSGMAMAVAAAIDNIEIPGVAGTIAGDDTVMCAIRSTGEVASVMEKISKFMKEET